jgi:hypothetical protein
MNMRCAVLALFISSAGAWVLPTARSAMRMSSEPAALDRRGCFQLISSTVVSLTACTAFNKPAQAIASAADVASVRAAVDALMKEDPAKVIIELQHRKHLCA